MLTIDELENFKYQTNVHELGNSIWDVAIVGAGPAGSYTGIHLARNGMKVLLIDGAQFPRDKICGDGLIADSIKCLKAVNLIDDVRNIGYQADTITVYSPSGHMVDISGDFITLKRKYLDAIIARYAVQSGCRFVKAYANGISTGDDGNTRIDIKNSQSPIYARIAIVATGTSISLPQKLNLVKRKKPSGLAMRCYIKSEFQIDKLIISYDKSILPGYAWIFPLGNGEYNAGCGTFYSSSKKDTIKLKNTFDRFFAHFPQARQLIANGRMISPLKGCPLRCGLTGVDSVGKDHTVAIGETIGATFPFTGEGIGKAMETGEIAAAVVSEALMTNDLEILNQLSTIIRDQVEPRYLGYKMAEKLCKSKIFLDRAILKAGKSRRMQNTLAGVVNETIDLNSLFTVSNVFKAFSKGG